MKKTLYTRNRSVFINEHGKKTHFKTVNDAKKESRKLQIALDGALGRGSVAIQKT